MKYRVAALVATCVLFANCSTTSAADTVTTGTMVEEMVDLDRLSDMPEDDYKTLQFTSYDRRSSVPDGPGWFSNSDGFGGAPIPPFQDVQKKPNDQGVGEYVMVDVEGPGVIVRTWTAAIQGSIRVYLDDSETPIYDGPAIDFLQRPYDTFLKGSDVTEEMLKGTFYQRDAGYCPMPFAKRCRIVWIGNPRRVHFYYVQVRKYDSPDVKVETFKADDLKTYGPEIAEVAKVLADPDTNFDLKETGKHEFELSLEPGHRSEAVVLDGPGAVEQLALLVKAKDEVAALRQTVMHISCDGWSHPQVQSPVGDFFAVAPGVNPYVSLPFTVMEDGQMVSRYVMPYKKSLRVEFENLGDQPVVLNGSLSTKDRKWDDDRSMHFYARWRVMHDLVTSPPIDIPFLVANGAGRYVGTASLMMNPARGTHPSGSWWGEGDEKVFVDDDKEPSWFGTGSEDYYNYSWSSPDIFFYPYCGQPRNDGPANRGFVTNNRFHVIDDQPFDTRCSFYMELLAHTRVEGFSYACQAYHYGRPGMMDDSRPITKEDVRKPKLPGPYEPLAVRGSNNATYLEPEKLTDGVVKSEDDDFWSAGQLMVWKPKAEGETLKLTLPVKDAGTYEVRLGLALDNRSGKVSATLDGEPFGFGGDSGVMDLYDARRTMIRCSPSKRLDLTAGDHVLELKFEGPADGKEPLVGIDFIWLQPR
ncbi:glycoside hydrolase family 172 protein [Aeoliella sp.]|uniref:glycoside hydrolase family 172 protein n=1 Tax=Aeoliella sp. TaxID=2795800 RepID=UPI003CCBAE50